MAYKSLGFYEVDDKFEFTTQSFILPPAVAFIYCYPKLKYRKRRLDVLDKVNFDIYY